MLILVATVEVLGTHVGVFARLRIVVMSFQCYFLQCHHEKATAMLCF